VPAGTERFFRGLALVSICFSRVGGAGREGFLGTGFVSEGPVGPYLSLRPAPFLPHQSFLCSQLPVFPLCIPIFTREYLTSLFLWFELSLLCFLWGVSCFIGLFFFLFFGSSHPLSKAHSVFETFVGSRACCRSLSACTPFVHARRFSDLSPRIIFCPP